MCGRRSRLFLVLCLAFSSGFVVLSWGQDVVVPRETWVQIVSKVDTLEKILADLNSELNSQKTEYERLLSDSKDLLTKERRWSEILGNSLTKCQRTNDTLGAVVWVESGMLLAGLLVGGLIWLF